jgi:DNA-binding transcriptional ArsR family regulator
MVESTEILLSSSLAITNREVAIVGDEKGMRRKSRGRTADLDKRIARALNHPLRARLLTILNERCASPKELSDMVEADLSNVSYHVSQLLKFDCIEVVRKEQVRGAIKTKYRASTRMLLDDETWVKLTKETRNGISLNAVSEVIERASKAIERGTFDKRPDRHVITLKMDVDEQGWSDVASAVAQSYERLSDVEGESANRTPDPKQRFRVTVSLLSYESPTGE